MLANSRSFLAGLTLCFLVVVGPSLSLAAGKVVGGKLSEHPDWFKESFLDIAEDVVEAVGAFMEKRKPIFKGK